MLKSSVPSGSLRELITYILYYRESKLDDVCDKAGVTRDMGEFVVNLLLEKDFITVSKGGEETILNIKVCEGKLEDLRFWVDSQFGHSGPGFSSFVIDLLIKHGRLTTESLTALTKCTSERGTWELSRLIESGLCDFVLVKGDVIVTLPESSEEIHQLRDEYFKLILPPSNRRFPYVNDLQYSAAKRLLTATSVDTDAAQTALQLLDKLDPKIIGDEIGIALVEELKGLAYLCLGQKRYAFSRFAQARNLFQSNGLQEEAQRCFEYIGHGGQIEKIEKVRSEPGHSTFLQRLNWGRVAERIEQQTLVREEDEEFQEA